MAQQTCCSVKEQSAALKQQSQDLSTATGRERCVPKSPARGSEEHWWPAQLSAGTKVGDGSCT